MFPEREDSWMFHTLNLRWTRLQAKSMKIPQEIYYTSGVKEVEVEDLKEALGRIKKDYNIEVVVAGAFRSNYQRSRIEKVANSLNLKIYTPLWMRDPIELLHTYAKSFKVIVTGVFAMGFNERWLGRVIDENAIRDLLRLHKRLKIDPLGEGGEYETFVLDSPIFNYEIVVTKARIIWLGDSGKFVIEDATLTPKPMVTSSSNKLKVGR